MAKINGFHEINVNHPELQPGEEFYSNKGADVAARRVVELNAKADGYLYRLGNKAFDGNGTKDRRLRPIFRKSLQESGEKGN